MGRGGGQNRTWILGNLIHERVILENGEVLFASVLSILAHALLPPILGPIIYLAVLSSVMKNILR